MCKFCRAEIGAGGIGVKRSVRCIADRRPIPLSLLRIYRRDAKKPLPSMDQMLNAIEHSNFFENRATSIRRLRRAGRGRSRSARRPILAAVIET